jgi:hypothetical protein
MSNKAALEHSAGQFTTMVSVDCTALEMSCMYFHKSVKFCFASDPTLIVNSSWVTPVVVIVGVGLLINNVCSTFRLPYATTDASFSWAHRHWLGLLCWPLASLYRQAS